LQLMVDWHVILSPAKAGRKDPMLLPNLKSQISKLKTVNRNGTTMSSPSRAAVKGILGGFAE